MAPRSIIAVSEDLAESLAMSATTDAFVPVEVEL